MSYNNFEKFLIGFQVIFKILEQMIRKKKNL
jgi:hypothetical protein